MKPTRPLTGSELEAWENSRNLETELLESVRQMIARKGRVVFSQGAFVKKKITDNNSSILAKHQFNP